MVKWTYSEQMLLFYIRTFKDSMWPGGKLAESIPPKTDAQKFETRMAAKNKLLQNIPGHLFEDLCCVCFCGVGEM
jgi:sorting nexin-25